MSKQKFRGLSFMLVICSCSLDGCPYLLGLKQVIPQNNQKTKSYNPLTFSVMHQKNPESEEFDPTHHCSIKWYDCCHSYFSAYCESVF